MPNPTHTARTPDATRRGAPGRSRSILRVALLGAGLVAILSLGLSVGVGPASASDVPYDDPNAIGIVGLCDRVGNPVHEGSIDDRPFVWAAVASTPAPAPYDGEGRTATLLAFQPRQGLAPGEWSGELLTASAQYTNPTHPRAQFTELDGSIGDFVDAYPAQWDGLVQLRIYLGVPNEPLYTLQYAATDIQIEGDRWSVVRGGDVDCHSGTAVSLETRELPSDTLPPDPTAVAAATAATTLEPPVLESTTIPAVEAASLGDVAETAATEPTKSDSSFLRVIAVLVIGAAVAASAWAIVRRRRT